MKKSQIICLETLGGLNPGTYILYICGMYAV